jgi:hypothetical protein
MRLDRIRPSSSILNAAATWQIRWTLSKEQQSEFVQFDRPDGSPTAYFFHSGFSLISCNYDFSGVNSTN